MKRYIRATTEKPKLNSIHTDWEELEDESGIKFIVYSDDDEVLFEELFDYQNMDPDTIGSSARDFALIALSQKYDLSDEALAVLQ